MARDENVKIFQDTEKRVKEHPGLQEALKHSMAGQVLIPEMMEVADLMPELAQNRDRYAQDPVHNDDCIYTPGVIVFKADTAAPEPLPEKDWYAVNVITCAAPNLRLLPADRMNPGDGNKTVKMTRAQQQALHEKRLTRILDVAVAGGNEVVILGAFGCGAFENDPEAVAAAFYNVIARYRKCFKTMELAIYCSPRDEQNYNIFKKVFG